MKSTNLDTLTWLLRLSLGATAFLAGADKFFNLLAEWTVYLSPLATAVLPLSADTVMRLVGVVEMAVGIGLLAGFTRLFGYVIAAWLVGIAINLLSTGQFFDVAIRDLNMAAAAYVLARLSEARAATVKQRIAA